MRLARRLAATALVILMVGGVLPAPPLTPPPVSAQAQPAQGAAPAQSEQDARDTRQELQRVLDRYPPALGRVLKMDPSLLNNQAYLATYPALGAFLAAHPEVGHNPAYFLAHIEGADSA